jgi:aspartate/methionine/tyrosine aminotransferase
MALRAKEAIIARNLDIIRQNLSVAEQFFAERRDRFLWIEPQAGSIAFPRWLAATPVEQFCQDVLAQQNVMIVPGSIFDFPGNHFRVGLGRQNFAEALQRVSDYLRSR